MNKLDTWLPISSDSDFSIYNLPYGIYSINGGAKRAGIAIGDKVVNLTACAENGWIDVDLRIFQKRNPQRLY